MQATLLKALVDALMVLFSEKLMKEFADYVLDFVEDRVLGSASTIDDKLVLPICEAIRKAFNIPDND